MAGNQDPEQGAAASIAVRAPAWIQQLQYHEQVKTSLTASVSQLQQQLQEAADAQRRLEVVMDIFQSMCDFDFATHSRLVQMLRIQARLDGLELLMEIPKEVPDDQVKMPDRPAGTGRAAQLKYDEDVKRARKNALQLAQKRKREENVRMLGDDNLRTWKDVLSKRLKEIHGDKPRQTLERHANACQWYIAVAKQEAELHKPVLPTAASTLWVCYKDLQNEDTKLDLIRSVAEIRGTVTCTAATKLVAEERFSRPQRTSQKPSEVAKRATTLHLEEAQPYLDNAKGHITQAQEQFQVASDKVIEAERLKQAASDPEQLKQAALAAQASVELGQGMLAQARTAADKAEEESFKATRAGQQSPGACRSLVETAVRLSQAANAATRKADQWQRKFTALMRRATAVLQPAAAGGDSGAAGGDSGAAGGEQEHLEDESSSELDEDESESEETAAAAAAAAAAARARTTQRGRKRRRRGNSLPPAQKLLQRLKRRCATPADWHSFFGPQISLKQVTVRNPSSQEPGTNSHEAGDASGGSISRQQHIRLLTRRMICGLCMYWPELPTDVELAFDGWDKMVLGELRKVQLSGAGSSSSDERAVQDEVDVCKDALASLLRGQPEEASSKLAQGASSNSNIVSMHLNSRLRYTASPTVEVESEPTGGSDVE